MVSKTLCNIKDFGKVDEDKGLGISYLDQSYVLEVPTSERSEGEDLALRSTRSESVLGLNFIEVSNSSSMLLPSRIVGMRSIPTSQSIILPSQNITPIKSLYNIVEILQNRTNVKIRLNRIREYFGVLRVEDLLELKNVFCSWRDYNEYLLVKGIHYISEEIKILALKCSKRGNDVFARRLDSRLGFLNSDEEFFNPKDFDSHKNIKPETGLLWITLTYDAKKCSLDDAWSNVGQEFNLWITNLRNKYGRISYCLFPQAFPDPAGEAYGYVHFHGIFFFLDKKFRVFRRLEKDREGRLGVVYRVQEKDEIHAQGKWHSHIDVKALSSMKAVWNYAKKHCYNAGYGESDEASFNNAVMWVKRKRSFCMSGDFREKYIEFIHSLHNSKSFDYLLLDGVRVKEWKWVFLGVFDGLELRLGENFSPWTCEVDKGLVHELVRLKNRVLPMRKIDLEGF